VIGQNGPACVHHPESRGVAQCVTCQVVLCGVCTTRIQGRNLCARCLAAELAPADANAELPPGTVSELLVASTALGALGALGALFLGVFAALNALGWG
jgi:hypothetical protein